MRHKKDVFKHVLRTYSAFTLFILLFECTPAFTFEEESTSFPGNFIIRQEKYESGGVWISRPVLLDEKILDIIRNNNIRSLRDYEQWLGKNIKYKKDDGGDSWSPPRETLQKKYGDCEDYAFLNKAVLRVLGYQPKVVAVGKGRDHAICIFRKNGYYLWFDNAKLKMSQAPPF